MPSPPCNRLLLVDDERENLDVLCALLEDRWQVEIAESGDLALARLERGDPVDLIISDQRMPGMTGIQFLTRVARLCPATVRIVLTGYSDVEPMLEAINEGSVYRFLLKPFDPVELRAVVEDAISIKFNSDALRGLVETLSERRQELRKTMDQIRRSQDQLVASERRATLGRATSGIVHDLRNAGAVLFILVDLVREKTAHPEILAAASTAWDSLSSLLELLEQIRDFASSSSTEINREQTDIDEFLGVTLRLLKLEQVGSPRAIDLHVEAGLCTLYVDRRRLRQALMTLLRGAVAGGIAAAPLCLRVWGDPMTKTAYLEVSGANSESLVDASDFDSEDPGDFASQIGIEIVRLAAAAHGGRLELKSGPTPSATLVLADSVLGGRC